MAMTRRGFVLTSAVQSGQGPDVALMHVDRVPRTPAHGTILPLDGLVRDLGLQEGDFAAPVWRAGAYRGRRSTAGAATTRS
jgi:multiple sugar transport system substrate-binding protein